VSFEYVYYYAAIEQLVVEERRRRGGGRKRDRKNTEATLLEAGGWRSDGLCHSTCQ
jgi:hypothetical protein